ncbi:MAG TPA: AAA family ATPase [Acidimicrobiales bacterium]
MTLRPFTPSRDPAAVLDDRTVGRNELLSSLLRRLASAAQTKNRPHTLLVGPRGSGKTHVIDVLLHRLAGDPLGWDRFVIARLDEDAVGVASYADLLLELGRSAGVDVRGRDAGSLEAALVEHLDGRVLLAVIENLARVFGGMGTAGQRDLRSFVETTGAVVILASTPQLFSAIGSRNEPWFGSFAVEHLEPLTVDECADLLGHVAGPDVVEFVGTRRGRARLAALHHLVGGWPRLWMVIAGSATPGALDELVPAVEQLVEQFVPSFQQRLWSLAANEARLVRVMGTGPPAATVAELADAAGLTERTAATALGRLSDGGWVRGEKRPGADQRRTWYRLREPLLRLHFQYRGGADGPLRETVEYVRAWFDPSELVPPPPADPEAAVVALLGRVRAAAT